MISIDHLWYVGLLWGWQAARSALEGLHAFLGPHQADVGAAPGEQADGDDADDLVDFALQRDRVKNVHAVHIQDDISVVGGEAGAQHRVAAQFDELACNVGACHGDDFDRQRELAHDIDQFGLVDDADKFLGAGGDDFFPRQRAAAAFDHGHVAGDFIGAIDIDFHLAGFIQVDYANADFLQAFGGGDRGGDRRVDAAFDVGERVNEKVGGGAGADADDPGGNIFDRGARGGLFHFVLGHHDAVLISC